MKSQKKTKPEQEEATDWDLSEGMGVLPDDISLTQNIGCVGGKPAKGDKSVKNPTKNK